MDEEMPPLMLYSEYSRLEVHDIFSPDTRFTQSRGPWGMQGIIEIPNKPGDFVFFVTYGQRQADHTFDEWITKEGVISWQSQPRQSFEDRKIQKLIHHNEKNNTIHLFLRTHRSGGYFYLGGLKYLSHNPTRENPVYMYWQLSDWPIPTVVLERINLQLQSTDLFRQVMETGPDYRNGNSTFKWHGKTWNANRQELISQVRNWIIRGLPEEAVRYRDWYINVDNQRISPKWLFHLITGAGYNEFDAPLARRILSKIELFGIRVRTGKESDQSNREEDRSIDSGRMKPAERQILFENISKELSKEFPDAFRLARFRFPNRENWFEIHLSNLKGYYSLRLAKQFDEFAYFFPGTIQAAEPIAQQLNPYLKALGEEMGYTVMFELGYWQGWSRFGFEIPYGSIQVPNNQELEITYARKLGRFILATNDRLVELLSRRAGVLAVKKSRHIKETASQIQILTTRMDSINQVLSGSITIPSDDVLCEWIHFCYDFELYKEGQLLFELVSSEQVNPWYYERTKKFARLCSVRTAAKE
jgi:hypothetical protein